MDICSYMLCVIKDNRKTKEKGEMISKSMNVMTERERAFITNPNVIQKIGNIHVIIPNQMNINIDNLPNKVKNVNKVPMKVFEFIDPSTPINTRKVAKKVIDFVSDSMTIDPAHLTRQMIQLMIVAIKEKFIYTQEDIYFNDSSKGKRDECCGYEEFLNKLVEYKYVYKNLQDDKLKNNLDFSKLCMCINPNIYPYLIKEHQENQEIIDFVKGLTPETCRSLNFMYSKDGKSFADRFHPYSTQEAKNSRAEQGIAE